MNQLINWVEPSLIDIQIWLAWKYLKQKGPLPTGSDPLNMQKTKCNSIKSERLC